MNEQYDLRALRADAPVADSEWLASQRATLSVAFHQKDAPSSAPARARIPRRRFVMGTAGAAALAVAGAVVVSLPGHSAGRATNSTHDIARGGQMLSAQASAATLEMAAATVSKLGSPEPGPKQWVYEKSTSMGQGAPRTSETWTRWDGTGSAELTEGSDPSKLHVEYGPNPEAKWKEEGFDDRTQRQFYDFLATLPSDPELMMNRILQAHAIDVIPGETAAQREWREIDVLYGSVLIPPNAQAGLFRALAQVPGARVEKGIKDPIGRPVIGVTVNYAKAAASGVSGKQEMWFDASTYAYLGEVARLTAASPELPSRVPNGTQPPNGTRPQKVQKHHIALITVRNAWGVVDKPGERP